jgi:hypothetical protein
MLSSLLAPIFGGAQAEVKLMEEKLQSRHIHLGKSFSLAAATETIWLRRSEAWCSYNTCKAKHLNH